MKILPIYPWAFFSHDYRAYSETQPDPINYFTSNQLIEYIANEADTLKSVVSIASPYKDIPALVADNTGTVALQPAPLPGESAVETETQSPDYLDYRAKKFIDEQLKFMENKPSKSMTDSRGASNWQQKVALCGCCST